VGAPPKRCKVGLVQPNNRDYEEPYRGSGTAPAHQATTRNRTGQPSANRRERALPSRPERKEPLWVAYQSLLVGGAFRGRSSDRAPAGLEL
jgi:hypothetical protein